MKKYRVNANGNIPFFGTAIVKNRNYTNSQFEKDLNFHNPLCVLM